MSNQDQASKDLPIRRISRSSIRSSKRHSHAKKPGTADLGKVLRRA